MLPGILRDPLCSQRGPKTWATLLHFLFRLNVGLADQDMSVKQDVACAWE